MSRGVIALVEGLKAVAARPWRSLVVVALTAMIMCGGTVTDLLTLRSALAQVERLRAQGADVVVVQDEGGDLDGASCDRAARIPGVLAAGGVSAPRVVVVDGIPGASFRVVEGSPGYLGVILPQLRVRPDAAVVVSPDVVLDLGLVTGSLLSLGGEHALRVQVAVAQERALERRRWLTVLAAGRTTVKECWVAAAPGSAAAVGRVLPALFPQARDLRLSHLVPQAEVDAAARAVVDRPSRWAWVMAAIGIGLVAGILMVQRRSEFALYRILSAPTPLVAIIAFIESWVLLAAGTGLSVVTTLAIGSVVPSPVATPVATVLSTALASVGLAGAIAAATAIGIAGANPARSIRARQ